MSPRSALVLLSLIAGLAAGAAACSGGGQPIDLGTPGGDDDDGAPVDPTFTTGAFPALETEDCGVANCHAVSSPGGGLQLPDAAGSMTPAAAHAELIAEAAVNTGSPASSLLLTKGLGTAHGGGPQWETDDVTYRTVIAWITTGAQMN